jgi:hypothetical protein
MTDIKVQDSSALQSKYFSVTRANQLFQNEVESWLALADEKYGHILGRNFSQMKMLHKYMKMMVDKNKSLNHIKLDSTMNVFLESVEKGEQLARATEFVWDYFRDKLQQRLVPQFEHYLCAADLIVNDCYRSVMEQRLTELKITLQEKRETPLPFIEPGLNLQGQPRGATTYRAGVMPRAFHDVEQLFNREPGYERNKTLPIAVIELPFGIAQNIWELVVLGHEVTHDIDGDLNSLHDDLGEALKAAVANEEEQRRHCWEKWGLEIFADLMALRFMGPAYLRRCLQILATSNVVMISEHEEYPSNYLRMLLMLFYLRDYMGFERSDGLGQYLKAEAKIIDQTWKSLYGDPPLDHQPYMEDFTKVIEAMMNTNLPSLDGLNGKRHTAGELVTFLDKHWKAIKETREALLIMVDLLFPNSEQDDGKLREQAWEIVNGSTLSLPSEPPMARHVVSAAYLAFLQILQKSDGEGDVRRRMKLLNILGQELVKAKQPKVKLAEPTWTEDEQVQMSARIDKLFEMLTPSANKVDHQRMAIMKEMETG